ncbi:MAG: Fibronectin type III domain protein, partial [Parcubacteria group bacterium GW2011_GWA2_56_21]
VVTVGAPVVVGWWNSTNTGVNVVVPVDNTDLSLVGGTIQLTENNGGGPLNVGSAYTITAPDVVAGTKTLSLTAVEVEGVAGFVEGDTLTFSAIITDVASNGATGTASLNTFTVDQTAPVVNAGVDKEVKILTAQLATVTDTGGSGVAAYAWTKQAGSGIITFGTPAAEDTDVSASTDDTYTIRLTSTDVAGNSALDEATFVWDTTAPTLAEVTAIPTPSNDATPSYTFSASHVGWLTGHTGGTVTYTGACGLGSVATTAAGNNTTTYTVAPNATYTDCDIQVTDAAGNTSSVLQVNDFEVDTITALVSSITTTDANLDGMVDTATIVFTDEVKDSTFSAGAFSIGGVAATTFTIGTANDNTVVLSHAGVAGTNAKTVSYTPGTATDLAGNALGAISQTSTDAAGPVMLSAITTSTTMIEVTFSEDLNGATVTNADFTVGGNTLTVPDAAETTPTSGIVILNLLTPMGTGDTPLVSLVGTVTDNPSAGSNPSPAGQSVIAVDGVSPTLSGVTIKSNNDGDTVAPEWARVGDTATLTFTSSEPIAAPTVSIDGRSASVSNVGNDWTATYTFVGGEDDGTIPFSIAFADVAIPTPNTGTTVIATNDGSSVFFDEVNPTVNAGTDKEVNAPSAQDAAISDAVPPLGY